MVREVQAAHTDPIGTYNPDQESKGRSMERLARAQPGFNEMQSVRGPNGVGITVCYWESDAAISGWRQNVDHAAAQQCGKDKWYTDYRVTIARVERSYGKPIA